MGATTIVIRGYLVKGLPRLSDRQVLVVSRGVTLALAALAFLLGSFVVEILRSITEIAVLMTSIVTLVALGGLLKQPSRQGGLLALLVSLGLLLLFLVTGWAKKVHPFWPVFLATVLIVGVSTWLERKKSASPRGKPELS
jgi:uncharacterized membrane protein (UPF0136 family)